MNNRIPAVVIPPPPLTRKERRRSRAYAVVAFSGVAVSFLLIPSMVCFVYFHVLDTHFREAEVAVWNVAGTPKWRQYKIDHDMDEAVVVTRHSYWPSERKLYELAWDDFKSSFKDGLDDKTLRKVLVSEILDDFEPWKYEDHVRASGIALGILSILWMSCLILAHGLSPQSQQRN